jgi:RHS repeat-associated protein
VRKIANGVSTYYVNNAAGQTELVQKGASNSVYTYNIYGKDNIGQVLRDFVSISRYYYLKDHLGSVRVTVDINGTKQAHTDYYPFGMTMPTRDAVIGAVDTRFKFTGKERDVAETGYDYFGARYYDSWGGRFTTIDRFAAKYPSMTPYQYAADNPVLLIDRNGDSIQVVGKKSDQALTYVKKQAGGDAKRISVLNGFVQVNREGYKKGSNTFIDKLIEGVDAKKKIGLEITGKESIKISETQKLKISNLPVITGAFSSTSTTSFLANTRGEQPPSGFDGYVKVSDAVGWLRASDNSNPPTSQIVGHELIENINRTVEGMYYPEAHADANNTSFGGAEGDPIDPVLE